MRTGACCACACTCVHVCACMYPYAHANVHVHVMYVHARHTWTCPCACMSMHMDMHMCMDMYVHRHVRAHVCARATCGHSSMPHCDASLPWGLRIFEAMLPMIICRWMSSGSGMAKARMTSSRTRALLAALSSMRPSSALSTSPWSRWTSRLSSRARLGAALQW